MVMEYPPGATPLDQDELEGLKFPHVETRAELDELEQQNIQEGYRWLSRQRKHKDFLVESFTRELHKNMFGTVWAWAGTFRNSEKSIGIDPVNIGAELRNLLDDARVWVDHATYEREEFAARFHHRVVLIHPFPNGNGRFGRIITDVVLEKELGASPVNWGAGELLNDGEHRQRYLAALRAADKLDIQPLVDFVSRT
jgi:Fic-DOC domain mobile mystery protein B